MHSETKPRARRCANLFIFRMRIHNPPSPLCLTSLAPYSALRERDFGDLNVTSVAVDARGQNAPGRLAVAKMIHA